jgi:hypothetical protein
MNEISIQHQLEHFKTALEILKDSDYCMGICTAIDNAILTFRRPYSTNIFLVPEDHTIFTEYAEEKGFPINKPVHWFPLNDYGKIKRIQILKDLIIICESKPNQYEP